MRLDRHGDARPGGRRATPARKRGGGRPPPGPLSVLAIKSPGAHRPRRAEAAVAEPGAVTGPLFPVILHPTDLSDRSPHAFDLACAWRSMGAG